MTTPFNRCLELLIEAKDIAHSLADEMVNGHEFAELLSDALAVGQKDVWPLTDEQRAEDAKDRADGWRFERNREAL